jgi:hypothetical protein
MVRVQSTDRTSLTVDDELMRKLFITHRGHEGIEWFNVWLLRQRLAFDLRDVNERFGPVAAQGIGFIFMSNPLSKPWKYLQRQARMHHLGCEYEPS